MDDISAIMGEGSTTAPSKAAGKGEKAGPVYDIWYLLKVFLVIFLIVGVFHFFMEKQKERKLAILEEESEESKPNKKKK